APYGLAPVLGECGTVGAGFALGGGLGFISGKYGASCDNLLSSKIITADGRKLVVNASTSQDLYWGIRGGGGNFGVATTLEYKLHPLKSMIAGGFIYSFSKARDLLRFFREYMSNAPDELQAECYLTTNGNGLFEVDFVYIGNLEDGEKLINSFRKFSKPDQDSIKRRSFSEVYQVESGDTKNECAFESSKGHYIRELSNEVIDLIIDRFKERPPSCEMNFNFSHYMHGEVCRISPGTTAFELRESGALHIPSWIRWKDSGDTKACMNWHDKTFELLLPYSGGRVYANFMSAKSDSTAIFGQNHSRLVELKRKYDPENFFHLNANIVPT
ncbi:MAG TPA: BBE domain-containing protein, partial [Puia sp.]|nr:BBE domain-containing protein [Puia sp.]